MSVPFAVQTVWPVTEFDAQEFTLSVVEIRVFVMLLPSTFTVATPVEPKLVHAPLGTYEITFVPLTSADSELDGWHEPVAASTT